MNLFITRLLSAICLYLCLAIANQQSVIANLVLVCGYRAFLIFSFFMERIFLKDALQITLGLVCIGLVVNFFNLDIIAALLVALGLSVSGFLIKKLATETPSLAGLNKIALSSGNIIAGGILYAVHNNSYYSWVIAVLLMLIAIGFAPKSSLSSKMDTPSLLTIEIKKNFSFYAAWFCIGSVIGIRIFGLYTVLPAYLKDHHGVLPEWYGPLLALYGCLVIITQLVSILTKFHPSLNISLAVLGISCIIIGVPGLLEAHFISGAIVWVSLLAIEEIFAPYIDFYSAKDGKLFIKEISIGIGGGICVLIMRLTEKPLFVSTVACFLVMIGYQILQKRLLNNKI